MIARFLHWFRLTFDAQYRVQCIAAEVARQIRADTTPITIELPEMPSPKDFQDQVRSSMAEPAVCVTGQRHD